MNKDMLMYASGAGIGKSGLDVALMDQEVERGITVVSLGLSRSKSITPVIVDLLRRADLPENITVVELKEYLMSQGNIFDEPCEYPLIIADDYCSPLPEYFEGSLIVPASNKTKGSHAYPWYHGGKW